jgi:hypothetical protein
LDLGQTLFHGRDLCIISLLYTAGRPSLNDVMVMVVECSASSRGEVVSLFSSRSNNRAEHTHEGNMMTLNWGFPFSFRICELFILWNNSHIFPDQPHRFCVLTDERGERNDSTVVIFRVEISKQVLRQTPLGLFSSGEQ